MVEVWHAAVVGILFSVFFIALTGTIAYEGWNGEMTQAWSEFSCQQAVDFISHEPNAASSYIASYKSNCHPTLEQEAKMGLITP